jgi:hypothetical protein
MKLKWSHFAESSKYWEKREDKKDLPTLHFKKRWMKPGNYSINTTSLQAYQQISSKCNLHCIRSTDEVQLIRANLAEGLGRDAKKRMASLYQRYKILKDILDSIEGGSAKSSFDINVWRFGKVDKGEDESSRYLKARLLVLPPQEAANF